MNRDKLMKISFREKLGLIFLGIILAIIILELALRLGGFIIISWQEYKNRLSLKQKDTYRIMCLGESTTQGQYPAFLEEILNQWNIGIRFSVIDKGLRARQTADILSQLDENLDIYKPDMVVAMMGVNDAGLLFFSDETGNVPEISLFFKSLKVSNLLNLLWLHIVAKTKEVAEKNSNSPWPYFLGFKDKEDYTKKENFVSQEELFKKEIELNPQNTVAYVELGRRYRNEGRIFEAEQSFRKALDMDPKNDVAYVELGKTYKTQERLLEAEESYKKALALNPTNIRRYADLETMYLEKGDNKLFEEYMKKARQLGRRGYESWTINNYLKLQQILNKRGVRLVCVQYPMLVIKPLKELFDGQNGVIFVDNEKTFKDVVKSYGYKVYFKDMFAGEFGHCTDKGNKLLAENIANVIVKEVFNK